jgi:hypothetical protein
LSCVTRSVIADRAHHIRRVGLTIEPSSLVIVAHLVVSERKVVQTLSSSRWIGTVDFCVERQDTNGVSSGAPLSSASTAENVGGKLTCQETNADAHVCSLLALDQTPRIVELGLGGNVARGEFGFVLRFEHLELRGGERCLCVCCVWK